MRGGIRCGRTETVGGGSVEMWLLFDGVRDEGRGIAVLLGRLRLRISALTCLVLSL
jgi:hypothetical protein